MVYVWYGIGATYSSKRYTWSLLKAKYFASFAFSPCLQKNGAKGNAFFDLALYTVHCANVFFRTLRKSGIFLFGHKRRRAVRAGMDMNDPGAPKKHFFVSIIFVYFVLVCHVVIKQLLASNLTHLS